MSRATQIFRHSLAALARTVGTLALWTLWLGLGLLLCGQIYIASVNELALPDFILHRVEDKLAASGMRATFGRTSFDPTGRVLLDDVGVWLPGYDSPVFKARSVFVHLNPWLFALGLLQPEEIRLTGASAAVPAALSPSGAPEELIRDVEATLRLADRELRVVQLSARAANLAISAHGLVPLPRRTPGRPLAERLAEFERRFPTLCRQAIAAQERLSVLQAPSLDIELGPSDTRAPQATLTFDARGLALEKPWAVHAAGLQLATRVLLLDDGPAVSRVDVAAGELQLPAGVAVDGFRATAYGRLRPGNFPGELRTIEATLDRISAAGASADALSADISPRLLPQLDAEIAAQLEGTPLAMHATADLQAHTAEARLRGEVSPRVLDLLDARLKVELRNFLDFAGFDCRDADVRFGPEWKFAGLSADVALQGIKAHGVTMDEGRAVIEFDGAHVYAPYAYARIGENFARGTYEQDVKSRAYRFLLTGRLRPMAIAPWFREWWPDFFRQLELPAAPPDASVDVRGTWHEGLRSNVFVFADATQPVVRGVAFDRLRTRLFVRPSFFDIFQLDLKRGAGTAQTAFTLTTDLKTHAWRTFDVRLDSSLELGIGEPILGPAIGRILAPFKLEHPPELRLQGRFASALAPGGRHQDVQIDASSAGLFQFDDFPLRDVSLKAHYTDAELVIEQFNGRFAGGTSSGHARVWGEGAERRLGFDYALKDASLGDTVLTLQTFIATKNHQPPPAPGKFVQQKANVRLDLAASAEGHYGELLSFHGGGNAALRGAEIGEVPLLGALSDVIKFTSLRFTSARANFKIDGPKLEFSEVALRGANSAIDAHGDYALDRRQLDFKAKIFPFQESGNLIKNVVGAVLTPLSNVFEVKLTGSLEKPQWALVLGPTNFLRSLTPEGEGQGAPGNNPPPAPAAGTPNGRPASDATPEAALAAPAKT